jgi:ABC-type dipeptide/oligopeptide/nickel transport system permease subunit
MVSGRLLMPEPKTDWWIVLPLLAIFLVPLVLSLMGVGFR